jgi:flavodoxin
MNIQVIYESQYGNTERVARAIAEGIGTDAHLTHIGADEPIDPAASLVVIGGPTQGHGMSAAMRSFLGSMPKLEGKPVATFDTRLKWPKVLSGAASDSIATTLREHGATLVSDPASFLVGGREGPLLEGELERATTWGKSLRTALG